MAKNRKRNGEDGCRIIKNELIACVRQSMSKKETMECVNEFTEKFIHNSELCCSCLVKGSVRKKTMLRDIN